MPVSTDQFFARTLSASGIASFVWDLASGQIECNEVLASVLGLPSTTTVVNGAALLAVIDPEDRDGLKAALDRARETATALRYDLRVTHAKSGQQRRVVLRAMYHTDPQTGNQTIAGMIADVTVRDEANATLRISEERHRLIFDASPVPMFIVDAATQRFQMVNRAAATLLGYTVTELELMVPADLVTIHARPLAEGILTAGTQAIRVPGVVPLTHRDGSLRFADVTVDRTQLLDAPVLIAAAIDVTARIEAEARVRASMVALKDSEERHAFALDATTEGLWDWDLATGALVVNARWARMLGYEPEELEPSIETWQSLAHPDDVPRAYAQLDAHTRGEIPQVELDMRMKRKDGTWGWILNRGKIVARDATGAPIRVVGTHADISSRRDQQNALERQAAVLNTVLSNIPIAINILGADGSVEYVNRACEDLLGWTLEEMRSFDLMKAVYPDPEYLARVTASLEDDSSEPRDWTVRTKSGAERLVSRSHVRLPDGRSIGLGIDVTEVRRREAEEERFSLQLEQAQKLESLGVLAGGIAHDFNNLLVGILGNASLAEGLLPHDSPATPLVAEVRSVATRAADLTRQLLAYAGKGNFVVEPLDVSALVGEMTTLVHAALSKRATLVTELAPGLPPVRADATQLRQIVMNLLTNASDALNDRSGQITLRTGVMVLDADYRQRAVGGESLEPGSYVFIEVEDDGAGMSEETKSRIFDPFFTTKFTGRGLGLAATLGIVRSHGGAISVDSQLERGTTFRLVLPVEPAAVVAPTQPAPTNVAWTGSGVALLADDESFVRRVLKRSLERSGFSVVECEDGREAVDLMAADPHRFSIAILDLTMPRLAGDAALAEIKVIRPDLPAVLCSGYSAEELDPALIALPGVRFLQKPFSMASIAAALQSACEDVGLTTAQ